MQPALRKLVHQNLKHLDWLHAHKLGIGLNQAGVVLAQGCDGSTKQLDRLSKFCLLGVELRSLFLTNLCGLLDCLLGLSNVLLEIGNGSCELALLGRGSLDGSIELINLVLLVCHSLLLATTIGVAPALELVIRVLVLLGLRLE